jgi:hypothetical protein
MARPEPLERARQRRDVARLVLQRDAGDRGLPGRPDRLDAGAEPVAEDEWVPVRGQRVFTLALRPPADCEARSVEVHVTQRSTGQTAVVEFSLDPTAAGPGCYTV